MAWVNDTYYYSSGILKAIAKAYGSIYEDGLLLANHYIDYLYAIAEYKADFDRALLEIGKGEWRGLTSHNFKDYKYYGRLQRVVIAEMLGITDAYLIESGFYDIPKLRGIAYFRMTECLNSNERQQN